MNTIDEWLQKALSDWQSWNMPLAAKPVLVRELHGGKTNHSFVVDTDCGKVVVRVNAKNSSHLGINRIRESEILTLVSTLGCVPQTFFMSEQVLVSQYIDGKCWQQSDFKSQENLCKLENLIDKIQKIPVPKNSIKRNYVTYCQHYIQQLPGSESFQQSEKVYLAELLEAAEMIDQANWQPVINHHDLVPENIMESEGKLFLLDWEYAAYGHPGIDFIRLYGEQYQDKQYKGPLAKELHILEQGIDKLWYLLQHQ